jgi:hypothetical protein
MQLAPLQLGKEADGVVFVLQTILTATDKKKGGFEGCPTGDPNAAAAAFNLAQLKVGPGEDFAAAVADVNAAVDLDALGGSIHVVQVRESS